MQPSCERRVFTLSINRRNRLMLIVIWQYSLPVPAIRSAIVNSAVGSNMRSEFISVEIALHSDHESREWIEWFQKQDNPVEKISGTDAKWFIYFAPLPSGNVDSTISSLCDEIDDLPEHIKAHWDNAIRRQFFIGYQAGFEWPCLDNRLSHDTLRKVVGLSAELRLAIYPATTE